MQPYSRPASRRASDLFWGLTEKRVQQILKESKEERDDGEQIVVSHGAADLAESAEQASRT